MAILRSVVDVNNGNTGWTQSDVLDALETVFANLGFHGGTATTGVPVSAISPTGSRNFGSGWETAARDRGNLGYSEVYYDAISQGTSAYRVLRKYFSYWYRVYNSTDENRPNQFLFYAPHRLSTGDAIHWAPGGTVESQNVAGLTLDTVYYAIVVDEYAIKVAANATDAANGTEITLNYGGYSDSNYAAKSSTIYGFRQLDDAEYDNAPMYIYTGDRLNVNVDDQSGGNFSLCGGTDDYDATKLLNNSSFRSSYATSSANTATTSNITSGTLSWLTYYWHQTEDERSVPDSEIPLAYRSLTDNYGIYKYIYASNTHASMKGEVIMEPRASNNNGWDAYWKYTVPANGGRSELKLRVYRDATYNNQVEGITVNSVGSGWTEGDSFTIPGDQIGGVSPEDDIDFGVRTPETSTNARNGVCQLYVTNFGAGSNFYQKSDHGRFAVLKVVNDAAKNYGTSYYGFGTSNYGDYDLYVNSGSHWSWMNVYGTNSGSTNGQTEYGYFDGVPGLDRRNNIYYINRANDSSFTRIRIASTSTPTAYPMSIRVYRAQAPQDTNFAVIQFCQTINGNIIPYGAFTIHKGATFGSNVWDLDNVYLGTISTYGTSTRAVDLQYMMPGYYGSSSDRPTEEPVNQYSRARESAYGYFRNVSYGYYQLSRYICNIDTENDENQNSEIMTYYRNSTYDRNGTYAVDANADYYKPIKGIPIAHNMVPCPYYLPDDFVMLQFSTTPGATVFRPGDTVTVGPSEVYEVILAGYQTSQNGLDNVDNNSSIGMLFLARTT